MKVIAKRMLLFVEPEESAGDDKYLVGLIKGHRRVLLNTSPDPQECPEWVGELDSFRQATEAGAIERVA